jgi:hypothetical protein
MMNLNYIFYIIFSNIKKKIMKQKKYNNDNEYEDEKEKKIKKRKNICCGIFKDVCYFIFCCDCMQSIITFLIKIFIVILIIGISAILLYKYYFEYGGKDKLSDFFFKLVKDSIKKAI